MTTLNKTPPSRIGSGSAMRHNAIRRSGLALLLVVAVISIATMMSVAIVSSSSLQAQLAGNSVRAAEAQYLAESAVDMTLYYLQRPENAPLLVSGKYPGQNNVTFGANVIGTANVAVTTVVGFADTYDIAVSAAAGADSNTSVTRSLKVRAYVPKVYVIDKGLSAFRSFTIPSIMTVNGDVRCDGTLTNHGTVNGAITATGSNATWTRIPTYPTVATPTAAQLTLAQSLTAATPNYAYTDSNGITQTGTPQLLSPVVTGALLPAASNPMNVWYANGDVTMGDVTIDGTLAVVGAGHKLTVTGDAHIKAKPGMPALLVNADVRYAMGSTSKSIVVDGLAHIGGSLTASGLSENCGLTVNGALMLASPSPSVSSLIAGAIDVNFVADNVKIPNLANTNKTPASVRIVKWDF